MVPIVFANLQRGNKPTDLKCSYSDITYSPKLSSVCCGAENKKLQNVIEIDFKIVSTKHVTGSLKLCVSQQAWDKRE